MVTIALVDRDPLLAAQMNQERWSQPVRVIQGSPREPGGHVVVWNMSQFPSDVQAVRARLDPRTKPLLLWEDAVPPEAAAFAHRSGLFHALSKRDDGLAAVVGLLHRLVAQWHVACSDEALVQSLVDRNFSLSFINEVLHGLNRGDSVLSVYENAVLPIVEMVGGEAVQIQLANERIPDALQRPELEPLVPRLLHRLQPGSVFEVESQDGAYMAAFPMVAHGTRVGNLILTGAAMQLPELEAAAAIVHSLCGQIAMAITNIRHMEEFKIQAIRDSLTGIYNRRHFQRQLSAEFDRSRRYRTSFSLVMIDVDRFKSINDTHGHKTGDRVLVEVARLMGASLRQSDLAARYGGEEFVLLLPETSAEAAAIVAERLRVQVAQLEFHDPDLHPIGRVSASFGVTEFEISDQDPQEILERADKALYRAKNGGRNRVVVASSLEPISG